MTFSLVLLILEIIIKIPDIAADIRDLIAKIRGLPKAKRLGHLGDLSTMLRRHAVTQNLRGTDVAHDIALMHLTLDE